MDYKGLKDITMKDKYPIRLVDDLLDELHDSTIYSKVDLRVRYHHNKMRPEDIHKKHLALMLDNMSLRSCFWA